jgi:hypothetical protein
MRLFGFPVLSRGAGVMVHADETVGRQSLLPGKTLPLLKRGARHGYSGVRPSRPARAGHPLPPGSVDPGWQRQRQAAYAGERAGQGGSVNAPRGWPGLAWLLAAAPTRESERRETPHTVTGVRRTRSTTTRVARARLRLRSGDPQPNHSPAPTPPPPGGGRSPVGLPPCGLSACPPPRARSSGRRGDRRGGLFFDCSTPLRRHHGARTPSAPPQHELLQCY